MALRARQNVSDEGLMLRFQRGEVTAFAELVHRHKIPLFNFVLRQIGSRPAAEDTVQEVFLRVVQNAGEFKHEARFTTWLYTIARHLCIDHLRKMALRNHDSLEQPRGHEGPTLGEQTEDRAVSGSVERAATSEELRLRIVRAVESLPDEQREVFLLREVANLPFKEISEITSTPENTVKSRMRYALERLQEMLTEYEEMARSLR
ncbi:MAG TPA: RNA polymerase sigma factor [Polyangiaceae bacterium]|nr:RNA polymerase sigma factor [Polyangiaceae bacterium]